MDEKTETIKVDGLNGIGISEVKVHLPSNSHRARDEKRDTRKTDPKKVKKVTTGKVIIRKKSLGKRFFETFVGEDVDNVWTYVLYDVLIPAARNTLSDLVHGSADMVLRDGKRGSRSRRDSGRSYVSYNNYSSRDRDRDRRDISQRSRAVHDFDDILVETREEADEVLSNLSDLIFDYGQATVADFYDLVGVREEYTDRRYGWKDLRGASASRAREGGYQFNLPRTILLD